MRAIRAGAAVALLALGACGGGGDGGPPAVATVSLSPTSAQVEVGLTTQLTASVQDSKGNALSNPVTWSSSATTVASVSATGVVTGVAAGSATITAVAGGKQGTASITVVPPSVQSVAVSLAASTIEVARTTTATAVLRDVGGNTLTGRQIAWTTGNSAIATVSAAGVVTGVAAGSTTVVATSEGKTGSATVTVTPPAVATVTVSLNPASVVAGATAQATFVARDAGNNVLTGRVVAWSSSNQAVATINAGTGAISAVAAGTATMTATVEGKTGSALLTVTAVSAGVGTVTGTVTAADGTTPIGDALVEVEGTSAFGGSATAGRAPISTRSAANGTYTLQNVPAGPQVIVATRGAFQARVNVTVVGNQTVVAPKAPLTSTGKLAYVRGVFDKIQNVVTSGGNAIEEIEASDLANSAITSKYRMIFLNCGLDETFATDDATIANLRAFMQAGGTIYASDYASVYVKGLFPTYNFDYAGDAQTIQATVTDASLEAFVAKPSVTITYDLDAWTDVIQLPTGATVLLRGSYVASSVQRDNQPIAFMIPQGSGRLVFTTFHNETGATQDQIAVLRHFIYLP
jgi:uncharacterized protein YjdB